MFRKKNIINRYNYERIFENIKSAGSEFHSNTINKLLNKFKNSRITAPDKVNPNVITINTRFRLRNLGNGLKMERTLVLNHEKKGDDCISVFEEQGAEILSCEVGDVIYLDSNGGYFQIENILYQPEAEGVFQ